MRLGLISDTHNLLRPEALQALAGVDRIVHAGDICRPEVLDELGKIAPLTTVRGNNDLGSWAEPLPQTALLQVGGVRVLVVHDLATLALDPQSEGIDVVVSGHSHRPRVETRGSTLYVNPGSAGPRRFRLPISLGFLEIRANRAEARLQELRVA